MANDKLIVLVTGGNQGLGYYAIQQMSATGKYHILMGSRDITKAEKAIQTLADDKSVNAKPEDVEPLQIDMSSDESIKKAATTVEEKFGRLDILMANAGIAYVPDKNATLRQQFQQIYDTNVFGTTVTVETFLPLLRKSKAEGGKRIAFTSSGLSSLEWAAQREGSYSAVNYHVYRSSKTALSMVLLYYARSLEAEGFIVSASDPGYCATNLNAYNGLKDPREGAKVLVRAAEGEKKAVHGRVVGEQEGEVEPW